MFRFAGDRMFMSSSAREPMAGCSSRAAERAYRILRILSHREKTRRPTPAAPPATLEVRAHTEEAEAVELNGFLLKLPNLSPMMIHHRGRAEARLLAAMAPTLTVGCTLMSSANS